MDRIEDTTEAPELAPTPYDDSSPSEVWENGDLSDHQEDRIRRDFLKFRGIDLLGEIEEADSSANARHNNASLGGSVRHMWAKFRDAAVERLIMDGKIGE